jgi:hypothetical protein
MQNAKVGKQYYKPGITYDQIITMVKVLNIVKHYQHGKRNGI